MVFKDEEQSKLSVNSQVTSFSWNDVKQHTNRDSCWIVIDGDVYDITNWLGKHPGGDVVLLSAAAADCTDLFNAYHPQFVRDKLIKGFKIGRVSDYTVPKHLVEFRALAQKLESSSVMQTNPMYYFTLTLRFSILFAAVLLCVFFGPGSIWISSCLGGIFMGSFFQQVAFVGHDLGHSSVTHSRKIDTFLGLFVGNMLTGISMGWWKATHNAHHVATNFITDDPDIQHFPFFAVAVEYLSGFESRYHEKIFTFTGISKILIPLQDKLYYLVMAVARYNLYIQSYLFLLTDSRFRNRRIKTARNLELFGLIFFALWFCLLTSYLPTSSERIVFVLISHAVAGVLHVQITLSHFAMPVYTQKPWEVSTFVEHQIKTSLDIDCYEWLDWFHGGLQFQVVHHLFPRVPRHNLRKLRAVIKSFALKHQIPYQCMGFLDANKYTIHHLSTVSSELKLGMLNDMVNMRG